MTPKQQTLIGSTHRGALDHMQKLLVEDDASEANSNRPPAPRGFLFDLNRCTGCGACVVACTIESTIKSFWRVQAPRRGEPIKMVRSVAAIRTSGNSLSQIGHPCHGFFQKGSLVAEGKLNWRQVYTFNEARHPAIPLFNLSMACNHCGKPACVRGCPAGALSKDLETGAVTVDQGRCLGCKYCTWACPYDAPRYNPEAGVIEKCDFCIERLKKGEAPACVCACPTKALRLGELDGVEETQELMGFTVTEIQPAIQFKPLRKQQQVPEATAPPSAAVVAELFESSQKIPSPKISLKSEWTLLTFTSIAFILVALLTASIIIPLGLNPFVFLGIGGVGMVLSTVHLGKKIRALYAVRNFKSSWLSREIVLFSAFLGISFIYLGLFPAEPVMGWVAVLVGFLSLYAVDRIYQVAMQAASLNFHSAHTLFNGLFLTGALIGDMLIFGLSGLLKLFLYGYRKFHLKRQKRNVRPLISFLRIGFGFIVPFLIFIFKPDFIKEINLIGAYGILVVSVIIGELIDRTEYYDELDIVTPRKQMLIDLERLLKGEGEKHNCMNA